MVRSPGEFSAISLTPASAPDEQLVLGYDLDGTLGDTADAIVHAFSLTGRQLGKEFDTERARRQLGRPIEDELRPYFADEAATLGARDVFRQYMAEPDTIQRVAPLPGAHRALEATRERGWRSLVLTTKQQYLAELTLRHLEMAADETIGGRHGPSKTAVLARPNTLAYIGDDLRDVAVARAAGVIPVGVSTGNYSMEDLRDAGAKFVLPGLDTLPEIFDDILAAYRDHA